jgi:hypothetical protein
LTCYCYNIYQATTRTPNPAEEQSWRVDVDGGERRKEWNRKKRSKTRGEEEKNLLK